jgi:hypothetical protein
VIGGLVLDTYWFSRAIGDVGLHRLACQLVTCELMI